MRNLINLISENRQVQPAQNIPLSQKIYSFFQNANQLPAEMIGPVEELAATIVSILSVSKQIQAELQVHESTYSGATPNIEFMRGVSSATLQAALVILQNNMQDGPITIEKLFAVVNSAEFINQVHKSPLVKKATTAAIKGIQLNTRAEFIIKDKQIRDLADSFAKRFGLKPIWARNLIGMFDISVSHEDRVKFLEACDAGQALDISAMIKNGQGPLNDVVTTKIPKLQEIFNSIKETLLDISLSTGQRGATGPFEALVAIMGGGRKPTIQEGGDIVVKDGGKDVKLEMKSGSITVKPDGRVNGLSGAWLDSTAGKEVSPSNLRVTADNWLRENFPIAFKNSQLANLWKESDFRPGAKKKGNPTPILNNFKNFLLLSMKKNSKMPEAFIRSLMVAMFPSITKIPGYNFNRAVNNIVNGILELDNKKIAKEQGIMALLEYVAGKGNDGFLLFNSSTQEYKMIMGIKGVLELYKSNDVDPESSIVRFEEPMTMLGSSTKCSPSIYFGPASTSNRAKEYARNFVSDPKRAQLRAQVEASGDEENVDAISAFDENTVPDPNEGKVTKKLISSLRTSASSPTKVSPPRQRRS